MFTKSFADLHFVRTKEPIPTVEIDLDTLPKQCHRCADVLQKSLALLAKNFDMVATIYIYVGPSVNFHKHTWSAFIGVAGPKSILKNVFEAFSLLGGVSVRYSDDIQSSEGRCDVHIEDGKVWLTDDSVTWYADQEENAASDETTADGRDQPEAKTKGVVYNDALEKKTVVKPEPSKHKSDITLVPPIEQTYRDDVLCHIRKLFGDGQSRNRDAALSDLSQALGYRRLGSRIRVILDTDLITAVRRGILKNEGGQLSLLCSSIEQYNRDFLKEQFLSSLINRNWANREDAILAFARWIGFSRTGQVVRDTASSIINGLLREGRLEADGINLRRT